jgi:hypothetical protein
MLRLLLRPLQRNKWPPPNQMGSEPLRWMGVAATSRLQLSLQQQQTLQTPTTPARVPIIQSPPPIAPRHHSVPTTPTPSTPTTTRVIPNVRLPSPQFPSQVKRH